MSPKNLWGDLPTSDVKPPIALLKEQAVHLRHLTKAMLKGAVLTERTTTGFEHEFRIVAPALDDYEYSVLFVNHDLEMYPLIVVPAWDKYVPSAQSTCLNEAEFEAALANIFGSGRIKKVIASLLAQSKA